MVSFLPVALTDVETPIHGSSAVRIHTPNDVTIELEDRHTSSDLGQLFTAS